MKAKELMCGDWVMSTFDRPVPVKVYAIGQNFIDLRNGKVEQSGILALCDFEPIPLTPEILEKNGFKKEVDGAYTWYDDVHIPEQVYVAVSLRKDGSARIVDIHNHRKQFFTDLIPYGYFVHELQSALRCCGLNELADNFKV